MAEIQSTQPTATSVGIVFSQASDALYVQGQISIRPDFNWTAAPLFPLVTDISGIGTVDDGAWGGATIDDGAWGGDFIDDGVIAFALGDLNQSTVYYMRVRDAFVDGTFGSWSDPPTGFRTLDAAARNTTPAAVMIEPAIIVRPEPVLAWSASAVEPGFPVENMGRDAPVAWHATGGPVFAFEMQTAGGDVDTLALLQTNLPESATVVIKGGDSLAEVRGGAPSFATGTLPFRASANLPGRPGYHGLFRLGSVQRRRVWRVEITAALPGGVLHAEYAVLGWNRFSRNHALEKTETPSPLGSIDRRRSGTPDRQDGLQMRKVEFDLQNITEAQYETLYADLMRATNEAMLIVPNSKSGAFLHDRILFGDMTGGRVVNPYSPRYTRTFSIDSLI